ncbi:MAG: DUF3105 domain-containing protein [Acidimicrobiales bacterium]
MRAAHAGRSRARAATSAAFAALVLLAACGGDEGGSDESGQTAGPSTTVELASRVETFTVPPWRHVTGTVAYPQTPPVGGDHIDAWMNCGYYSQPVITEAAVHSMEHGAVWITFRLNVPQAQKDRIKALARSNRYVLASPWPDRSLPTPVVASAWGVQLKAQTADDPALTAFVQMYANGPQTPEKGAPCSGAFGNPE